MKLEVLVIGGGGREHALAWKVARSPRVSRVYVAPGNAGTAAEPKVENLPLSAADADALLAFARERRVGLTLIGPEAPLVAGLADRLAAAGLRALGPVAAAARLEGSKVHAKAFLDRHRIPTAAWRAFDDAGAARAWIRARGGSMVVKADGLAAGKGVTVAESPEEAEAAVSACLDGGAFGEAGSRVVVEERLAGEEVSFIALVGGGRALPLASSQDHKRRDEGDTGPNTGGMGACSPAPRVDAALHRRIMEEVIDPTVAGLAADGIEYTGFLYAGLMVDPQGVPRVLEYNCRLGDPETQPLMLRLATDLVELAEAALDGTLPEAADWDPRPALGVVMAAGGYPGEFRQGDPIEGLDGDSDEVKVFHAGTTRSGGRVVTAGGRVLCVTALGKTLAAARERAYRRVGEIRWRDACFRRDIGHQALGRG